MGLNIGKSLRHLRRSHLQDQVPIDVWNNHQKIRGVNLGGWLVLEKWITPSVFRQFEGTPNADKVKDEWSFCEVLGQVEARRQLEQHWGSWVTEDTVRTLRGYGLNLLRIPLGHWAVDPVSSEPYVTGALDHVWRVVEWARKYQMKVMLDVHTAPGSQNGFDNSGREGQIGWTSDPRNVERSLRVVEKLSHLIRQSPHAGTVVAIQPVNEPAHWALDVDRLINFYNDSYKAVRQDSEEVSVVFSDAFFDMKDWPDRANKSWRNVAIDSHLYHCFVEADLVKSPNQVLNKIRDQRRQIAEVSAKVPILVGEWSLETTKCYGNYFRSNFMQESDWDKPNAKRYDSNCGAEGNLNQFTPTYRQFLRDLGYTQVESYEAGIGWIFWNFKTEASPTWNYMLAVEQGWIPKFPVEN
ncbi:hypothetical protein IWQ60_000621 [Tieghemiomyces parasiticus]|uniref:glucan 1,3-beta-glucosidase n=1 Tax=Tieghemiomyces parasiticus TaxID=78921 RepID=A0A9W8AFJ1_9FUNG|nr:hypothetical protein IWQ60_000621 [Tieghemiomyces parasiticus]